MEQNRELTFEEALKRLETLVRELEQGDLPLDQSVAKYQEGLALAKRCHDLLKVAETVVVQSAADTGLTDFPKQE
ncbi:MAG: exodeoxyribonuclease VII small subunit [Candidatus Izemoplasmatales bacterium]